MIAMVKNTWWILLLGVLGAVVLFLCLAPRQTQTERGIVINDILHRQVPQTETGRPAARKADPVPPMAIVTNPVNGHEAGFTIQVYSFQDKNRAQTALQSLKNSGYQAFLVVSDLGQKGTWYRIRVGGIANEAQAHQMLNDIRKAYNGGFIVKPKN